MTTTERRPDYYAHGWRRLFHVSSYEVDPSGELRLASLFNYLQESAGTHADHLDLGYRALRDGGGLGFVLSRISVEISRMPRWQEQVSVVTWPKRAEKLLALRDFLVFPADEMSDGRMSRSDLEAAVVKPSPLVRATTAWLLIDMARKRPVRPERNLTHIPTSPDLDAIRQVPERLIVPERPTVSEQTRVTRYSDIDQNDHVNNARYVEWLSDFLAASAVPSAEHSLPAPSHLWVNFTGEVTLGHKVTLRGCEDEDGSFIAWIERDEAVATVSRFSW